MVAIVVAHSRNGVIGRRGELPWRLPTDLRRFREITTGGTVVMGRKTYESIPERFRPLPDRRNLVLSTRPDYRAEGAEVFHGLDAALDAAREGCFVIGGGETYRQALPLAQRVFATEVDADVEGDAFFPPLAGGEWRRVERSERIVENDHAFTFNVYERQGPAGLYDLSAARSDEQRRYMEELEASGICIFCPEHFAGHHREPVEHSGEHWYVTKNDYPYAGTRAHYLIVPHRHVTSFDELPDAAGAELWAIRRELKRRHAPLATATVERSGDMRFNGGSVAHLHSHFVVLDDAPEETVRFRVSAHGGAPR